MLVGTVAGRGARPSILMARGAKIPGGGYKSTGRHGAEPYIILRNPTYWGVTKVLSKIWSGTKALFVRTGEVQTPFPRRFLQFLGAEAEAWSPEPSNNNVL